MALLRLEQFNFGKEYELNNCADDVFAVSINKEYDGSGPFEFKTPPLKIDEAILFSYYIRNMFTWRALYKYYTRDDEDGNELEEKGNHLHFTILTKRSSTGNDEIKVTDWGKTKAFGVLVAIMLLTPLRKLLTTGFRFRNSFFKWNEYLLKYLESENRVYAAVTINTRNEKSTVEIRACEGGLGCDLHFINFTLMVYNIYSNLITDFDKFLLEIKTHIMKLENEKKSFMGEGQIVLQFYRNELNSVDLLKRLLDYLKEKKVKRNVFIKDLETYVTKHTIIKRTPSGTFLISNIKNLYKIFKERVDKYKYKSKELNFIYNTYFNANYDKGWFNPKEGYNYELLLFRMFRDYMNERVNRDYLDYGAGGHYIEYFKILRDFKKLSEAKRKVADVLFEIFIK